MMLVEYSKYSDSMEQQDEYIEVLSNQFHDVR